MFDAASGGIAFSKMHGLGNDFVVVDARARPVALDAAQIRAIADRHAGVGCDQLIVLRPPRRPDADAFMEIRNADGGEVEACGNATRCLADVLMRESGADRTVIETVAGLLAARRSADGLITVDMGAARIDWREIPLAEAADTLRLPVAVDGLTGPVATNIGNPHVTFFVEDAAVVALDRIGPAIERHPLFPQRVNVGVAEMLSPERVRLRVWERGVGITQACGSAACAALVAGARRGLTGRRAEIVLDGGTLRIEWRDDGHVLMSGPTATAFTGVLDPSLVARR